MVTILIAKDEKKVKEILTELLKEEGYGVSGDLAKGDGIIKIIGKDSRQNTDSLRDKVIELENSLFKEKKGVLYKAILEEIEKPLIENALERTEGNQLKAARILGINRNTIRSKIKKLGIDPKRWKV